MWATLAACAVQLVVVNWPLHQPCNLLHWPWATAMSCCRGCLRVCKRVKAPAVHELILGTLVLAVSALLTMHTCAAALLRRRHTVAAVVDLGSHNAAQAEVSVSRCVRGGSLLACAALLGQLTSL